LRLTLAEPYNAKKSEWVKLLHGECMGEHVMQSSWDVTVYVGMFPAG
jgi:hypothetical protein